MSDFVSSVSVKRIILEQSMRAHKGHIGSALSIADLVAALFSGVLRADDPRSNERDRFILSKGHAALALFAALYLSGKITERQLNSFCENGTLLGVHPDAALPGVDFSTGSLGQGLSYGAGCALAARLQNSSRTVFVLVSDAECDEGSLWEAVMFAAHHHLDNLVAIVDVNGQQALGNTREILDLSPLASKWQSFGWNVCDVDGHDVKAIQNALRAAANGKQGKPHVLLARTVSGCGVSFMERQIKWHYWPMSDTEFRQAMAEIGTQA